MPNPYSIELETKRNTKIENSQIVTPLPWGELQQARDLKNGKDGLIRIKNDACGYYNCHGLTFASRRTRIFSDIAIETIIKEDNYIEIEPKDILPGDVVIYYGRKGAVLSPEHSGIIISFNNLQPSDFNSIQILSKLGNGPEAIHFLNFKHFNQFAHVIKFYRMESIDYKGKTR